MAEETEAEFNARMARISAAGPKPKTLGKGYPKRKSLAAFREPLYGRDVPIASPTLAVVPVEKAKAKVITSEKQLEEIVEVYERRTRQGLEHFPFETGLKSGFQKLGANGKPYNPSLAELLRIVSSWYVKKDNKFYSINELSTPYVAIDIKQVIIQRIRVEFPRFKAGDNSIKDFFTLLLDPPVGRLDPEKSIPVWSGLEISYPNNPEMIVFQDGVATINSWKKPAYRNHEDTGDNTEAFDAFLEYVIKDKGTRSLFLDWLAWQLQNEDKKIRWAVMLYSEAMGTGKTALSQVCQHLFGLENSSPESSVDKLLGRFNTEVLDNKLIAIEEVDIKRGSKEANSIKMLITEDRMTVEAKNRPVRKADLLCGFLLATNHLPLWLSENDRRFLVLHLDHQGSQRGSDYHNFVMITTRAKDEVIRDPAGTKRLYNSLLARDLSKFEPDSLDVVRFETPLMRELTGLTGDVAKELLGEALEQAGLVFIPVKETKDLLKTIIAGDIGRQNYLMSSLGWKKGRFGWADRHAHAWYLPDADPSQGKVSVRGSRVKIADHLKNLTDLPEEESTGGFQRMDVLSEPTKKEKKAQKKKKKKQQDVDSASKLPDGDIDF